MASGMSGIATVMSKSRLLKYARSDDCTLRDNQKHQAAAAFALNIYKSNAIYTFIPKNACSTMRLSLAIANCCISDPSDFSWIHHNNPTFRADLRDLVTAEYTFVILRDPFARLASCFLDKIVSRDLPGPQLNDLLGTSPDPDTISFADFVGSLHERVVRDGNVHWRPQANFLIYDRYDDYFAVEDFRTAAASIKDRTGLEIVDARPFTAHGLDRYQMLAASLDHSTTPAGEIARLKRLGSCPHPRSLYTRSIKDAVAQVYAEDLSLYAEKIGRPTLF
jgi:Sulfotransferase family